MLEFLQGFDLTQIITVVLAILSIVLGGKYAVYFGKVGAVGKLLVDFAAATKDKKVSEEEMALLKADLIAIIGQAKFDKLFGNKLDA